VSRCATCGAYEWTNIVGGVHACPPAWEVYEERYHAGWEEARIVHAAQADEAAELYAERADDGGDYEIVGGRKAIVHVRPAGDDAEQVFEVEGESVPQYTARQVR